MVSGSARCGRQPVKLFNQEGSNPFGTAFVYINYSTYLCNMLQELRTILDNVRPYLGHQPKVVFTVNRMFMQHIIKDLRDEKIEFSNIGLDTETLYFKSVSEKLGEPNGSVEFIEDNTYDDNGIGKRNLPRIYSIDIQYK